MVTIYHNPKCKKSREGLVFLQTHNIPHLVRNYFDNPLSEKELQEILTYYNQPIIQLIRTQEDAFKTQYKGKQLTEKEWISAIIAEPKLLQRPLILSKNKVILAQPAELIKSII